jgi:hypothetical protein
MCPRVQVDVYCAYEWKIYSRVMMAQILKRSAPRVGQASEIKNQTYTQY